MRNKGKLNFKKDFIMLPLDCWTLEGADWEFRGKNGALQSNPASSSNADCYPRQEGIFFGPRGKMARNLLLLVALVAVAILVKQNGM